LVKILKMRKAFTFLALAAGLAISTNGTAQTYFTEDFESTSFPALPSGWTQNVTPDDSVGWKSGDNSSLGSSAFPLPAHTNFAAVNDDAYAGAANTDVLMKTGTFSLSAASASACFLSFDLSFIAGTYSGDTESGTVEVSYDGGTTWTVLATLSANASDWWETRYINMGAAAGHSSVMLGFRYKDGGGWLYGMGVDNIKVFAPVANDLSLTATGPRTGSPQSYATGGSNISMVGIVFNNGASTVTSYDVNYVFNGGSVVTNTISAVSIAPFTTGTFTATTPVTMPTALGGYPVRMWVSLTGDANHANDTSGTDTLTTVSFMPTKKLAIEEGTGTWCGWCVRGIVYMDSLKKLYGNAASLIAVHNGDPMTNTAYDTWLGTQISGYPSVVIDRTFTDDPSNLLDIYSRMHNNFGFADITAAATVTSTSVSVAATVKPALNLAGGYHLVLVLTEDQVHGTGTTWNQHNYYSYMSTNQDLWFEGVNYKTLADPIPAASMYYSHVARTITPSATGTSSSALPSAMTAGTSYPLTLNATVAAAWNLNNMHAIVMLIEDATGRVLNTQNADLTLGVENVNTNLTGAAIYPNPAGNVANIVFNLQNDTKVNVEISDVTGRIVSVVPEAAFAAGAQHITVNTTDLAPGVYNVKVNTESGSLTQRLTIAK
jgi:hypothetical protein